jgi:methyl-accepting chemotaxis protein
MECDAEHNLLDRALIIRTIESTSEIHPTPTTSGDHDMKRLNDLKVAVRLPLMPIIALAGLVIFALTALTTMNQVKIGGPIETNLAKDRSVIADILPPAGNLLNAELSAMEMRISLMSGDEAGYEEAKATLAGHAAAFRDNHDMWATALADDPTALDQMTTVRDSGEAYLAVLEQQFVPAADARDVAALEAVDELLHPLYLAHEEAVADTAAAKSQDVETRTTEANDLAAGRQSMLWTLLVVTVLLAGAAAYAVTRSVLRPLGELRRNLDLIASGTADGAAVRLDVDRRDEFGAVARSFNTFADQLVADSLQAERNAREAQARADEVKQAAATAAENMNTVAVASTELSAAAAEIARSAGDASRTANAAVQAADQANALMQRLSDSSGQIGDVVASIQGIAAQTTMLALNATIEAARAGEAGRGFAVVASEVKDLASETGSATADIVARVDQIQSDTQAALLALAEVTQVITDISSSQSVIAAAVEEQAATTSEIDRSLTEAVTAVNQLAGSGSTPPVSRDLASAAVPSSDGSFTSAA